MVQQNASYITTSQRFIMARIRERQQAIALRKQGKSYSQIKREIGISKSTLSVWLRSYPLSRSQLQALRDFNGVRIENYRKTMKRKREDRLAQYYQEQKHRWLPMSEKELFLAGLFLYWGEGAKTDNCSIYINNTDPQVLKFTLFWMTHCLKISKEKIHVTLHLYDDMDASQEMCFWSQELGMPRSSFSKPYIKKSKRKNIDYKGYGHGTCGLRAHKTEIKERILMAIQAIADRYQISDRPLDCS